jgi:hypothetical protein
MSVRKRYYVNDTRIDALCAFMLSVSEFCWPAYVCNNFLYPLPHLPFINYRETYERTISKEFYAQILDKF